MAKAHAKHSLDLRIGFDGNLGMQTIPQTKPHFRPIFIPKLTEQNLDLVRE